MEEIKRILFVCTGNSCRSVIAEFLLKKMIKESGALNPEEYKIYSAGINPMEGMTPPKNTVKVLMNEGINISGYRARRVTPNMIDKADVVLVMQDYHKESVNSMTEDKNKVYLLKEYCNINEKKNENDLNIPDPIGKPLETYEICLMTIRNCLENLIQKLRE